MFTGIVEEQGRLHSRRESRFRFAADKVLEGLTVGESVCHNGCCLTVAEVADGWYGVDVVAETLARTNLGDLHVGELVNLERPLRAADRFGGHLVQGHVDAVGEIVAAAPLLEVRIPTDLMRYVVEKGSVAVDGVSLTVARAGHDAFTCAVVPHTAEATTLGARQPGDQVNVEVDLVAKYVERLVHATRES